MFMRILLSRTFLRIMLGMYLYIIHLIWRTFSLSYTPYYLYQDLLSSSADLNAAKVIHFSHIPWSRIIIPWSRITIPWSRIIIHPSYAFHSVTSRHTSMYGWYMSTVFCPPEWVKDQWSIASQLSFTSLLLMDSHFFHTNFRMPTSECRLPNAILSYTISVCWSVNRSIYLSWYNIPAIGGTMEHGSPRFQVRDTSNSIFWSHGFWLMKLFSSSNHNRPRLLLAAAAVHVRVQILRAIAYGSHNDRTASPMQTPRINSPRGNAIIHTEFP